MSLSIKELNAVSTFLLPTLKISVPVLKPRLLNAYLYDKDVDVYKQDHITVVHVNYQDRRFKEFENTLMEHPQFVDSYDIADSFYSAKVYKISDFHKQTYQHFLEGKYSKFNLLGRSAGLGAYSVLDNPQVLAHVFFKSDELKKVKEQALGITLSEDSELWSKWDETKDVLTSEIKDILSKKKIKPNNDFLNEH